MALYEIPMIDRFDKQCSSSSIRSGYNTWSFSAVKLRLGGITNGSCQAGGIVNEHATSEDLHGPCRVSSRDRACGESSSSRVSVMFELFDTDAFPFATTYHYIA